MNRCLALVFVILSTSLGHAQPEKSCQLAIPVVVVQRDSVLHNVSGLNSNAFVLKSGKTGLHPSNVDWTQAKRIFLFIDASGSMSGRDNGAWEVVTESARELLSEIPGTVPVVVDLFALTNRRFDQRTEAWSFIKSYPTQKPSTSPLGSLTKLNDTMRAAADAEKMGPDDLVILVSDGGDNKSRSKTDDVIRTFNATSTRVISLLVTNPNPATVEEQLAQESIPNLSAATGGFVLFLPRKFPKGLQRVIPDEFFQNILGFYRLQFGSQLVGKKIDVTVLDDSGMKRRDVVVHFPHSAPECVAN